MAFKAMFYYLGMVLIVVFAFLKSMASGTVNVSSISVLKDKKTHHHLHNASHKSTPDSLVGTREPDLPLLHSDVNICQYIPPPARQRTMQIYIMTKNEWPLIKSNILYHGTIFGYNNLYVVDASTDPVVLSFLHTVQEELGVNVIYSKSDLNTIESELNEIIRREKRYADFIIKIDTDELILYYEQTKNEFSMKSSVIRKYLNSLIMDGSKFKLGYYSSAIPFTNCTKEDNSFITSTLMTPFTHTTFKTFFTSESFGHYDIGGHNGIVIAPYNNTFIHNTKLAIIHYHYHSYEHTIALNEQAIMSHKYLLGTENKDEKIQKLSVITKGFPQVCLVASCHKAYDLLQHYLNPIENKKKYDGILKQHMRISHNRPQVSNKIIELHKRYMWIDKLALHYQQQLQQELQQQSLSNTIEQTTPALSTISTIKQCDKKVLWFMAVASTERAIEISYFNMLIAAVKSAKQHATSLIPYVIIPTDVSALPLNIQQLQSIGVHFITHNLTFYNDLVRCNIGGLNLYGAFLRIDIPLIMQSLVKTINTAEIDTEYVLYTDTDVLFFNDFTSCSLSKPKVVYIGPEGDRGMQSNSGVLYMNITSMFEHRETLLQYANTKNWTFVALDQGLFLEYFRDRNYSTLLPDEYNWKGYWGGNDNVVIAHFHGPKPDNCLDCYLMYRNKIETCKCPWYDGLALKTPDHYVFYEKMLFVYRNYTQN